MFCFLSEWVHQGGQSVAIIMIFQLQHRAPFSRLLPKCSQYCGLKFWNIFSFVMPDLEPGVAGMSKNSCPELHAQHRVFM